MVNILNLKDPAPFLIQQIICLYLGLNQGPSDPAADDIPMCHRASLAKQTTFIQKYLYDVKFSLLAVYSH